MIGSAGVRLSGEAAASREQKARRRRWRGFEGRGSASSSSSKRGGRRGGGVEGAVVAVLVERMVAVGVVTSTLLWYRCG